MDHFEQNEAELQAQFGEAGPVAMAQTWMHLLLVDGDYSTAWTIMTPVLKLARAQAWLWNNRAEFGTWEQSLEDQAADLAASPSLHPEWDDFARIELRAFRQAWPPAMFEDVGFASRPRPIGPNMELVLVVTLDAVRASQYARETEHGLAIDAAPQGGVEVESLAAITLEHRDGRWWVSGHNGERLPQPGWPPSL